MNLYELTAQAKEVLSMDDIDKQTIEDTLEGLGLEDKFASYSAIIKTWKADSEALSNAIKQLQDKKVANENRIARLKDMALYSMKELDMTNGGNSVHSLTVRKGTALSKLVIDEGVMFPEEFVSFVAKEDKSGLKKAIKDGSEFEGFSLEDGEPSLLVK
jgi:hypothetical protein